MPNTKHGNYHHKLYIVWRSMINRCHRPANKDYKNYGARGITVCDEWRRDFSSFFNWCIANGWQHGLQLDREKVNEGYGPGSVRFITNLENQSTKRTNVFLTHNGETLTISQWARKIGVRDGTLRERIKRHKWTIERALSTVSKNKVAI